MTNEKERKVLEREFEWLLDKEYDVRVKAIVSKLRECNKAFSLSGDYRPPLLLQNDSALCTAAIEGDKITKAEINLKLSGRGSRPLRTSIKEHQPWKLKQVQDAENYLGKAYKWLDDVNSRHHQTTPLPQAHTEPMESTKDKKDPVVIHKSLKELVASLRKAESALITSQPISALHIYNSEHKAALRPSLPDETLLYFHIQSATLVLTILTLSHVSKSHQSNRSDTSSSYWVGSTFEHGSNVYEVTHQVQTASVIPWLADALKIIQGTLELAQDFMDKVRVFETMGLKFRT